MKTKNQGEARKSVSPVRQRMRRTLGDRLRNARAEGLKAAQYLAQIGRILGM